MPTPRIASLGFQAEVELVAAFALAEVVPCPRVGRNQVAETLTATAKME